MEHFGYRDAYTMIKHQFPNETPFTMRTFKKKQIELYGKELKSSSDISAMLCNLVAKGFLNRLPNKSEDGLQMYAMPLNPPELPPISEKTRKFFERRKIAAQNASYKRRWTAKLLLKVIDEKFPNNLIFSMDDLAREGKITSTSLGTMLRNLTTKGELKVMEKRGPQGRMLYRRLPLPEETQAPEQTQEKGSDLPVNFDAQPPAQETTQEEVENPINESIAPEKPIVTDDRPMRVPMSKEVLEALDIPLSILGEAVYNRMRDLILATYEYEKQVASRDREIDSLKKRMTEQFKTIEMLNSRIRQINDNNNKPNIPRPDAIAKLHEVAKFSTLRQKH